MLHEGKVILLRNEKGEYLLPKGHVEEGESLETAAIREVKEETGYSVNVVKELGVNEYDIVWDGRPIHKIQHHFLLKLVSMTREKHEDGHEALWFDLKEAVGLASFPSVRDPLEIIFKMVKDT